MKNTRGLSFVTIMIIIAVASLLLRFGVERIIKINIVQNELEVQATLKLMVVALENYAKDHIGTYPLDFSILVQNNPPYLDKNYLTESDAKGYDYKCPRLDASGYSCSASPVRCKLTGRTIYTVTTGGIFRSEECSDKD